MITILNASRKPVAVLDDYFNDEISEQTNGAYTFNFSVYMDEDKSQYIQVGNFAQVEGQLFNIIHHRRTRSDAGTIEIAVECEQVGYDLLFRLFEGGFIHTGTPFQLLQRALEGTGFTVNTVEPTGLISIDLKENIDARAVVRMIAEQTGGELMYFGYSVSLLNRRGQYRGRQFRLGKNLRGIVKDVNGQSGEVLTAYEVDVLELNSLPEFEGLESFELGDTVDIIDEELGINERQRIIQYSYSPRQRINSKVVIANYITGIQDSIYRIQTTTVGKDKWMYGVKIGPDDGIVIERYDKRAKSIFNADEFRMQKGNGNGSYTDALYFDPQNNIYKFNGELQAATGTFTGNLQAAGGTFTGNLQAAGGTFTGNLVAAGGTFSGDLSAAGGTFTGTLRGVDGDFSGTIRASTIIGSEIEGGTIRGSTISTRNGNGKGIVMNSGWADLEIYSGVSGVSNTFSIVDLANDAGIWFARDGSIDAGRNIRITSDDEVRIIAPGGVYVNGTRIG